MSPKVLFFILVITSVILETVGDIIFKKWSLAPHWLLFSLGMVVWMLSGVFWVYSMRFELLTKAGVIFTVLSLLCVVGVGVFYFKEELTWWNRIGLFMGLISIILLEI